GRSGSDRRQQCVTSSAASVSRIFRRKTAASLEFSHGDDASKSQVAQAAARDHEGQCDPGQQGQLRRIRPSESRTRPHQRPPDRSRSYGLLALSGPRRPRLNPNFPEQGLSEEAVGTGNGNGKGEPEFWAAEVKPGT